MQLDADLARVFMGGLLAVCRVDGEVNAEELACLRRLSAALGAGRLDEESLLLGDETDPAALAAAVERHQAHPYRVAVLAPRELAAAFVDAGLEVARSDGLAVSAELESIRTFAVALGADEPTLEAIAVLGQ